MWWLDNLELIIICYFVLVGALLIWFIVLLILITKDFIKEKKEKKGKR